MAVRRCGSIVSFQWRSMRCNASERFDCASVASASNATASLGCVRNPATKSSAASVSRSSSEVRHCPTTSASASPPIELRERPCDVDAHPLVGVDEVIDEEPQQRVRIDVRRDEGLRARRTERTGDVDATAPHGLQANVRETGQERRRIAIADIP